MGASKRDISRADHAEAEREAWSGHWPASGRNVQPTSEKVPEDLVVGDDRDRSDRERYAGGHWHRHCHLPSQQQDVRLTMKKKSCYVCTND